MNAVPPPYWPGRIRGVAIFDMRICGRQVGDTMILPKLHWSGVVKNEWIDYNGHMGDFAYSIAFTEAVNEFLFSIGFTKEYFERTGYTIYTLESHIRFLAELALSDRWNVSTFVVDLDPKRIHLFQEMRSGSSERLCANYEVMLMHVRSGSNDKKASSSTMPDTITQKLGELVESHRCPERRKHVGGSIGLLRR